MTSWTRPESTTFPSIWSTFEGKKVTNGLRREYWIQDLTDEYKDAVLHHMTTGFLREEIVFRCAGVADDPQSLEEFVNVWKKSMDMKLTLICLTKDDNGVNRLAGCNILHVSQKDVKMVPQGKALKMLLDFMVMISNMKDTSIELKTDRCLKALGLYVLPEYRGEGIGREIVKARRQLSLAVGLNTSMTIFTTNGGQKAAERAGFKELVSFPYADVKTLDSSFDFPGIENDKSKFIKIMYIEYSE